MMVIVALMIVKDRRMEGTMQPLYDTGHLIVGAIRVLTHVKGKPPSVEELAALTGLSLEQVHFTTNRLKELGVLEATETPFGATFFIRDHLRLETIERETPTDSLAERVAMFQQSCKEISSKVEEFKARKERERAEKFAALSAKLRERVKDAGN